MQFSHLRIENFMSIQSADISFEDGLTKVVGVNKTKQDKSSSNGSGKSAIFESIIWCLTGETQRGTSQVLRQGADHCEVELTVDEYTITREIPNKLTIIKNGQDISGKGIRDTSQVLKEEIPVDMNLLSNTIILGQGLPNRLTSMAPAQRKAFLETLFKTDFMIEDIKERIETRKTTLQNDLRAIEDENLKVQSLRTALMNRITENENKIIEVDFSKEQELNKLESILAAKNDENIKKLKQNEDINEKLAEQYQSKTNELKIKGVSLRKEFDNLQAAIKQKEEGKCPECGQPLQFDTTDDNKRLAQLLTQLTSCREEYGKSLAMDKLHQEEVDKLKSQLLLIEDTSQLQRQVESLRIEVNQMKALAAVQEELKTQIQKDKDEYRKCKTKSTDAINQRLAAVRKIASAVQRDFRGYLLQNVISLLDSYFKKYGVELYGHSNMEIVQDKNNLNINLNNKEYTSLSGGEKHIVDICLSLAIRDALMKYTDFNSNIIVIDEAFDFLDKDKAQLLLSVIMNLSSPSIYVITHNEEVLPSYDNLIKVKKDEYATVDCYKFGG